MINCITCVDFFYWMGTSRWSECEVPWEIGEWSSSRSRKRTIWKVLQVERSKVAMASVSGVSVAHRSHRLWTGLVKTRPADRSGSQRDRKSVV